MKRKHKKFQKFVIYMIIAAMLLTTVTMSLTIFSSF
ncbi:stressosome-associated protein Prli42 [Longirhabdus pacifica]|nr:stressosome-associated protein Prli42 [Longirhabdus pacifica]